MVILCSHMKHLERYRAAGHIVEQPEDLKTTHVGSLFYGSVCSQHERESSDPASGSIVVPLVCKECSFSESRSRHQGQ